MSHVHSIRRRVTRGLVVTTLAAAALTGVMVSPASAAKSQGYRTMAECKDAQRATGSTSFVAITKSCYSYFPQIVGGVWSLDPMYRFEYKSRY